MTRRRWYLCADGPDAEALGRVLGGWPDCGEVRRVDDPWHLRGALLSELPGEACAMVRDGCASMSGVNLAAALVADGHAAEVVLVCDGATGSLRSRARRAGIGRVMERDEMASVARPTDETTRHGEASARVTVGRATEEGVEAAVEARPATPAAPVHLREDMDLDEPDGVSVSGTVRPSAPLVEGHAPILTFASGRGGVGKTSIVGVAAHVAAAWGMRVAVVDYDLAFGNLFGFMGLDGPADLSSVVSAQADPDEAIVRCGRKVAESVALWGPCTRSELAETVQPYAFDILRVLSSRYDLVLVDTSTTWGDAIAQAVQASDRLLLVADERAGAIASVARAAALAVRLGVARTRIMRVMNGCDVRRRDEGFLARADLGLETARTLRVLDGGDEVAELLSSGHAQELAALDNPFVSSVSMLLAHTLEELGRLPADPRAQAALSEQPRRRRRGLWLTSREAS